MVLFAAIAIVISVLAVIIIIAVIIAAITTEPNNSNSNNECVNQNDCSSGFVCVYIDSDSTGICKSGVGTTCSNDDDCADNLICTNTTNSTNKVCTRKNIIPITSTQNIQHVTLGDFKLPTKEEKPDKTPGIDQQRLPTQREIRKVRTEESRTPILNVMIQDSPAKINICDNIFGRENVQDGMVRNVIPRSNRIIKQINNDSTSTDYEQNSDGDFTDGRFDVRSGNSTDDYEITSVSTPCEEKNGVYYCRSNVSENNFQSAERELCTITKINDKSPVIDVCSYSNTTVFLLKDGNIICENNETKKKYRTTNNIILTRITSFKGYLYGVGSDYKLYTLPNNYFSLTNWIWNVVEWAPSDIRHISSTHNSSHLWIQCNNIAILYSSPEIIATKIPFINIKRVYGRDVQHYIDIDPETFVATVHPGGNIINDVYDGALSYYDEVIAIHPSEQGEYRGITIVNWRPYYIRS